LSFKFKHPIANVFLYLETSHARLTVPSALLSVKEARGKGWSRGGSYLVSGGIHIQFEL
jgi:hypothetical protein